MRTWLLCGVWLLLSVSGMASAQTHPCDVATPASGTAAAGTGLYVYFCQRLDAKIDAVTVYRNGTPTQLSTLDLLTPTPNGGGQMQYRVSIGTLTAGSYSFELSNWNKSSTGVAQEGAKSAPFPLSVAGPVPPPPAPLRMVVKP
jgi:hypothetical protein